MSDIAIKVEGLSKQYRLGTHAPYRRLTETLNDAFTAPFRLLKPKAESRKQRAETEAGDETFWALKDVSFEIKKGEVVGIIGRNGAGKSTLLKILSRITEPTKGDVWLHGRVGSLLEVGTGFHPELSGRENIFLNGAILGMKRWEIAKKFDEIVAFSETEKFLDTPVKHYSSGMYMRLAFAVAAHLEPEILLVDEVLAVGDAQFQKKCMGKMGEVAKQGRTVLFVSHNMGAVLELCPRAIMFAEGRIEQVGDCQRVVDCYCTAVTKQDEIVDLTQIRRMSFVRGAATIISARLASANRCDRWSVPFAEPIVFQVDVLVRQAMPWGELGVSLLTPLGFEITSSLSSHHLERLSLLPGTYRFDVSFNDLVLVTGQYILRLGFRSDRGMEDYLPEQIVFDVTPTDSSAKQNVQSLGGVVVPTVSYAVHAVNLDGPHQRSC
jgi:lipopolysaccharide transport system ATP-binding protein